MSALFIDEMGLLNQIFSIKNRVISLCNITSSKDFHVLVVKSFFDLHLTGDSQGIPLMTANKNGEIVSNITDWGLEQFVNHYNETTINKEDIFNYVYAVLHNPAYRKKYEINLKREFPRIPFYNDFGKWAAWGKALMDLHLNYETVAPFPLEVITAETKAEAKRQLKAFTAEEPEEEYVRQPKIKAKLKADKYAGLIEIDELTTMRGIPPEAWEYKLGNRSAIEWILDQYKEKKPTDPTIAEKFNTYRFSDYKNQVIELIKKVCTVSVETVKIVKEMENYNF
jgi:predicted helicase